MPPDPSASNSSVLLASPHRKVLYLNITVVDASLAIESTVETRVHNHQHWLPGSIKRAIATRAAKAASNMASPPVVAHWLAKKLPHKLMEMLLRKGIELHVHAFFQQGPLVVFSIQVLKVDAVVLANSSSTSKKQGPKEHPKEVKLRKTKSNMSSASNNNNNNAQSTEPPPTTTTNTTASATYQPPLRHESSSVLSSFVSMSMDWLPQLPRQYLETRTLPNIVQQQLQDSLADVLRNKFHNRQVVAETVLLPQDEQARYFFDHLHALQLQPGGQQRSQQSQRSPSPSASTMVSSSQR